MLDTLRFDVVRSIYLLVLFSRFLFPKASLKGNELISHSKGGSVLTEQCMIWLI